MTTIRDAGRAVHRWAQAMTREEYLAADFDRPPTWGPMRRHAQPSEKSDPTGKADLTLLVEVLDK